MLGKQFQLVARQWDMSARYRHYTLYISLDKVKVYKWTDRRTDEQTGREAIRQTIRKRWDRSKTLSLCSYVSVA